MPTPDGTAARQALETIVKRFEQAWQSGSPPRIEDFLTDGSVDRLRTAGQDWQTGHRLLRLLAMR